MLGLLPRLLLLALLTAPSLRAQLTIHTVSYHGVSHAVHQSNVNTLPLQGFRLTSLTVAGGWANSHYSAVWTQQSGPPWVTSHGMTLAQYTAQRTTWLSQGYRSKIVSASGSGSDKVFAAVYVMDGVVSMHGFEIPAGSWSSFVQQNRDAGRRMVSCAIYGSFVSPTYAAVFEPDDSEIGWGSARSASPTQFGEHFSEWQDTDASPTLLAMNENHAILSAWRDVRIGGWSIAANRTHAELTADKATAASQGLAPLCIAAGGHGSNARYSAIFVQRLTPLPRTMTRTGQTMLGMLPVDQWVEDYMQDHDVRNVALAVTRHGRLVHARGFTWGEAGEPLTQPTSPFRIGSISKALTATLAHQVMQSGGPLSMSTVYVNQQGITNYTNGAQNIDLEDLLHHSAGVIEPDPNQMVIADWWATQTGTAPVLPPDENVVGRYTIQNGLAQLGRYAYSNASLTMVGQMVELATGQTYMQALKARVTTPLGITRIWRQQARRAFFAPGEVGYFPRNLDLVAGNLDTDQARMAPQYNEQFWDSAGGVVTSAVDLARVTAGAFLIGADSPILSEARQQLALTENTIQERNSSVMQQITDCGWFWYVDGLGRKVYHHNGGQRGIRTWTLFRDDGVGVTMFANSDAGFDGPALLSELANAVWNDADQFPAYGLPSFPRRPTLTAATVHTLPNLTKQAFEFSGRDLADVTTVQFGNDFLLPGLSTAWANGYVEHAGDTLLKVHPPQGLQPGSYTVRAWNAQGGSNTLTVTVTFAPSFVTMAQDWVLTGGQPFPVYVSRGPNSDATFVAIAISESTVPSVFPGIASLNLGNGFSQILLSDFRQCSPFTRLARWDFLGMDPLQVLHVQAAALDLAEPDPWPLVITPRITVDRL